MAQYKNDIRQNSKQIHWSHTQCLDTGSITANASTFILVLNEHPEDEVTPLIPKTKLNEDGWFWASKHWTKATKWKLVKYKDKKPDAVTAQ